MTSVSLSRHALRHALRLSLRRFGLATMLASSAWLAACGGGGGGGGNGTTTVRALNLTSDLASIDIFTGDTKQFAALTTDTLAPNASFEANTYTVNVKRAGDAATLLTNSNSLSKDQNFTLIVWGRETALRLSALPESETTEIGVGNSKVRVFNATVDSGTLDVYLTSSTADITDAAPTQSGVTGGSLAGFRDVSAGTYRLRVTSSGDPSDVRLDVPAVTLKEKQYATLVVTAAGTGGVLLNGTLIAQQGDKTSFKTNKARVRLAASVANGGVVTGSVAGTALFSNYRSPFISTAYATVDSGTPTVNLAINGTPVNSTTRSFAAGSDYTLLVYGTAAASQVALFSDDNRVPSSATRAKVRLINGLTGVGPLTMTLDLQSFLATNDVATGTASAYALPNVAGSSKVEVNTQLVDTPLFSRVQTNSNINLLAGQGVYTIFMLDGATTPSGRFVKDR
jgi:Domain of unknown function (DUF4397)